MRRHFLPIIFAVVALLLPGLPARAQESDYLKTATQLARADRPAAFYAYLEQVRPELAAEAVKAGLVEALDGTRDLKAFRRGLAKSPAKLRPELEKLAAVIESANMTPAKGQVAELAKADVAKRADLVFGQMWDGERHPYVQAWEADKIEAVGVQQVEGKLAWFNPDISIPELGIEAGKPLTEAQKQAVVKLFSVRIIPAPTDAGTGTAPAKAVEAGKAVFPTHVGRAINSNPYGATLVRPDGNVIPDLVIKGTGRNPRENAHGDGMLDLSEAYMDAELSRNLRRAGVQNYDGIAVIVPHDQTEKAFYVRAPDSMLRHQDFDKLSDADVLKTLELLARDAAIRTGKERLSVKEYLEDYLPRRSGENSGRLAALGVEHGSATGRDNHGLGETVDWGWAELHPKVYEEQKTNFWDVIKETVERANKLLPAGQKVDAAAAQKAFDGAYEAGKTDVIKRDLKIRLDPATMEKVGDSDLRTLLKNFLPPGSDGWRAKRADVIAAAEKAGRLEKPERAGIFLDRGADPFAAFRRAQDGTVDWARYRLAIKQEAGNLASFTLALFLKELAVVAQTGDRLRVEEFFEAITTFDFYRDYGLWTVGAGASNWAYRRWLAQAVKPRFVSAVLGSQVALAGGLLVPQLYHHFKGDQPFDGRAFAIDVTALGLSATAVKAGLAGISWVQRIGPIGRTTSAIGRAAKLGSVPGWIYSAGELAVILYVGDELSQWATEKLDRRDMEQETEAALERPIAILRAPGLTAAARDAALAAINEAYNARREFTYRALRAEEQTLKMRLAKLAKRHGEIQAGREKFETDQAGLGLTPAEYQSLKAVDERLRLEDLAQAQTELRDVLDAYERGQKKALTAARPLRWAEYARERMTLEGIRTVVPTEADRRAVTDWIKVVTLQRDVDHAAIDAVIGGPRWAPVAQDPKAQGATKLLKDAGSR